MGNLNQMNQQTSLTIKRIFNEKLENVFEAWTKPDLLAQWFGPAEYTVSSTKIDLKIGGKYHIIIQPKTGAAVKHFGEYVEIKPLERLAFTWMLADQACGGNEVQHAKTLVTIDFRALDRSTEIVLTHQGFPNTSARQRHQSGWQSTFDCFDNYIRM